MASPSICVGCGLDVSNASGRRLLYTDACQHVYVLWAPLFDEQLVGSTANKLLPKMKYLFKNSTPMITLPNSLLVCSIIISLAAIFETEANIMKMF